MVFDKIETKKVESMESIPDFVITKSTNKLSKKKESKENYIQSSYPDDNLDFLDQLVNCQQNKSKSISKKPTKFESNSHETHR